MPIIILPSVGNPIMIGIISVVTLVFIGYSVYQRKWKMFMNCLLVGGLLFLIQVFPQEVANMASKLADHLFWINKE
ncbi:hypothetical protein [Bacillus thuringiensis]|uniref:hypothetical protein n=1 Tax=Bacillus thuringiensis TaxID=1428 RepID=UPI001F0FAFAE|nr:hypothetical protein [Bacillus thuringiensis]